MKSFIHRRHALMIVLSATVPMYGAAATPVEAARTAAAEWLKLLDSGELDASWAQAASLFKRAVTGAQWANAARGVREPLGPLKQRREKSAQQARTLPGAPDGEYVLLQFESSFERKAAAVETVTLMLDADGRWRVAGYFIN